MSFVCALLSVMRIFLAGLTLAITLFLGYAGTCGLRLHAAEKHRTYSTRFPRAENPVFEGGTWINGETAGVDWANVRTTPGLAFGTESGKMK
jgi:hypothetical protein